VGIFIWLNIISYNIATRNHGKYCYQSNKNQCINKRFVKFLSFHKSPLLKRIDELIILLPKYLTTSVPLVRSDS